MKKFILIFVVLSIITLNFSGCEKKNKQVINYNGITHETHSNAVKIVKQSGICNISIDPKIELLSIVQYIADDPTIIKDDSKYSKDISNYFSKYKDDLVVSLYKDMRNRGFSYHIPPMSMVYTDDNLKILNSITLSDEIVNRAGGKDQLQKFFDLLFDFKKKSCFDEFYINHINYYNEIVSEVKNRVDQTKCIEKLTEYYGYKQSSFNVIIQPLSCGGYAGRIPTKDGTFDLYDFMVVPLNDPEFCKLLIHEFGHSYINPLTEQNIGEVNKYNNLFTSIRGSMTKQAYVSWDCCVNEHIVRAVTYKILYNMYGDDVKKFYFKIDLDNSFIYLNSLYERLDEYENNRDKYPTIKEFYPRLLDGLKDLSNKEKLK